MIEHDWWWWVREWVKGLIEGALIAALLFYLYRLIEDMYWTWRHKRMLRVLRHAAITCEVGMCRICEEPKYLRQGLCEECETFKAGLWAQRAEKDEKAVKGATAKGVDDAETK